MLTVGPMEAILPAGITREGLRMVQMLVPTTGLADSFVAMLLAAAHAPTVIAHETKKAVHGNRVFGAQNRRAPDESVNRLNILAPAAVTRG
jgi:hypothetical protein